ncbi:HAD-like domain-containing protein [Phakopsora pachyrhizi]|nr:HAD-like domain-containing protein [Phakopsora pachyrhizi]
MIYSTYLLIHYLTLFSGFKLFSCTFLSLRQNGEAIDPFKGYSSAERRVFFFDYDGTLTDGKINPEEQLEKLLYDQKNYIYIITARTVESVEMKLPRIKSERFFFVGEHGGVLKKSTALTSNGPSQFGLYCKSALKKFIDRTVPKDEDFKTYANGHLTFGFSIEELKNKSWYKIGGETVDGLDLKNLEHAELNKLIGYKVEVLEKIGFISLQPKNLHKGSFVQRLLEQLKGEGLKIYVLGMGNDLPDEPFFQAMHKNGFTNTIKVGNDIQPDQSVAKLHLENPQQCLKFLEKLTLIQ